MNDSISHPLPLSAPRNRRHLAPGFTMVEILTVIGIIVILIGMFLVAMKYARNSAAQSRTRVQMETLRGMLDELSAANNLSQSPQYWTWYNSLGSNPTHLVYYQDPPFTNLSGAFNANFWTYPYTRVNMPTFVPPWNPTGLPSWDALDSPGDLGSDGNQPTIQRNASFAIINTQLAMQMLASIPANRAAIDKLPANSKALPIWNAGPAYQAGWGLTTTTFVGLLKEDGTDTMVQVASTPTSLYVPGVHVLVRKGQFQASPPIPAVDSYFVCTAPATNLNVPSPGTNTAYWTDETAYPRGIPILLDGWGNPIIYVPATGLHVKLLNGQSTYLAADPPTGPTQEWIIISPEGSTKVNSVETNGTSNPQVSRPGKPFFASAGPDGDFTKGDDNIYSFNN